MLWCTSILALFSTSIHRRNRIANSACLPSQLAHSNAHSPTTRTLLPLPRPTSPNSSKTSSTFPSIPPARPLRHAFLDPGRSAAHLLSACPLLLRQPRHPYHHHHHLQPRLPLIRGNVKSTSPSTIAKGSSTSKLGRVTMIQIASGPRDLPLTPAMTWRSTQRR